MNSSVKEDKPAAISVLGYCLLHGDYHSMQADCWKTTVGFWLQWQADEPGITHEVLKNQYDNEVERKMLDNLIKELNPEETASA